MPIEASTTLRGTNIDLTFTRNINADLSAFMNYFSYHKSIVYTSISYSKYINLYKNNLWNAYWQDTLFPQRLSWYKYSTIIVIIITTVTVVTIIISFYYFIRSNLFFFIISILVKKLLVLCRYSVI